MENNNSFINYNALLDALFMQWKHSYNKDDREKFCEDGLMLKPDKSLNVDKLWEEAPRRVMFLLKDCPDGDSYDTRTMLTNPTNGKINQNLGNQFITYLAKILYGLLKQEADKRINDKYVNAHMDEVRDAWNTIPFAFIETKKLAGKPICDCKDLKHALERDKMFLKKEIDILRPNIIVCYDGSGFMFNFITKEIFGTPDWEYNHQYPFWDDEKQEEYVDPNVTMKCRSKYYKQMNVVVIDSYHPSYIKYHRIDDWEFQERVYCPFSAFLKQCDHNF